MDFRVAAIVYAVPSGAALRYSVAVDIQREGSRVDHEVRILGGADRRRLDDLGAGATGAGAPLG